MRHEKGIGHELPRYAADRAVRLIAEITGARVASGIVDNDPEPAAPRVVEVELARMERLLGISAHERRGGRAAATAGLRGQRRRAAGGDGAGSSARRGRLGGRRRGDRPRATATTASRAACRRPRCRRSGRIHAEPRHRVRRILAGLGLDEVVLHALIGADDLDALRLRPDRSEAGARGQPAGRAAQHHAPGAVPVDAGRAGRERPAAPLRPVAVRGGQDVLDGRQPGARHGRDRRQRALGGVARHHRRCWDRACRRAPGERGAGRGRGDPEGAGRRAACRPGRAATGVPARDAGGAPSAPAPRSRGPDRRRHGARLRQPGRGASARGRGVGPAGPAGDRRRSTSARCCRWCRTRCWCARCPPPNRSIGTWRSRWTRPRRWASCCACCA